MNIIFIKMWTYSTIMKTNNKEMPHTAVHLSYSVVGMLACTL